MEATPPEKDARVVMPAPCRKSQTPSRWWPDAGAGGMVWGNGSSGCRCRDNLVAVGGNQMDEASARRLSMLRQRTGYLTG
jgi:hypothetical protein